MEDIIEKITKSVIEMKRMRKSLRKQVKTVFEAVENACDENEITFSFSYDSREFRFEYFQNDHDSTDSWWIVFTELKYDPDEGMSEFYGFHQSMLTHEDYCRYFMQSFSNEDIMFLARNIRPILAEIQKKIGTQMAEIEAARKYLEGGK